MGKKQWSCANRDWTSRFWEPWSDCFLRFPTSLWIWNLKKKKKCYKFCSLQSRSYGGEGRLLERMVFVEEIEGIRDSDGGGRMAAAEACVWVSWLVELTELPFFPLKNGGPKEPDLKSQLIVDFVLHSQLHSGLDDIFTLWFWSKRKEEHEI